MEETLLRSDVLKGKHVPHLLSGLRSTVPTLAPTDLHWQSQSDGGLGDFGHIFSCCAILFLRRGLQSSARSLHTRPLDKSSNDMTPVGAAIHIGRQRLSPLVRRPGI